MPVLGLAQDLTSGIIAVALRQVVRIVRDKVGPDTPIPAEFWDQASNLVGDLAVALIEAGPSGAGERLVQEYTRRVHRLLRAHGLIETV